MFLFHLVVDKPQKVFVGAYRRHSFWIRVVKMLKIAAFSPLVILSNIFEKKKKKYCKSKKYFGAFNIRKRMLIRSVDIEISYHKGLYVRNSVKGTTGPVKERSIYFLYPAVRSY